MRKLLLIGTALAVMTAGPAMAGQGPSHHNSSPYFVPVIYTALCLAGGAHSGAAQLQCAINYDADPGGRRGSNDDNKQIIHQHQKGYVSNYDDDGLVQVQVGGNIVGNGDNNKQVISQSQTLKDHSYSEPDGPLQVQAAANIVEQGSHNTQVITQSQSLTIGSGLNVIVLPPNP